MTITYQIATLSNIDIVVDNRIKFAIEISGDQPPEKINALKNNMSVYFRKATHEGSCLSVIAYINGRVAGIGSVHFREMPGNFKNPSGKWAYIMNMYTVPEFRRNGVCQGILKELVAESRKKGFSTFELHATPGGEKVYSQNGFHLHNEPTLRMFT